MKIKNSSNPVADVVTVRESDHHKKDHVRLEIGSDDHNPRHANLTPAEARAVAYALLSYAELQPVIIDAGTF
jgi:hypothetical protein